MTRFKKKKPVSRDIDHLEITALAHGGDGIGQYDNTPVYIAKTAPGDILRARITREGEIWRGVMLDLLQASPHRIQPICAHFESCGGCAVQHLSPETYHAWKIDSLKTTLRKANITPQYWAPPIFIPHGTRRRATLALRRAGGKIQLGYHGGRSHTIIPVQHCPILDPKLDSLLQKLPPYLEQLCPNGQDLSLSLQSCEGAIDMLLGGEWGKFTLAQHETIAAMAQNLNIARISLQAAPRSAPEILLSRAPILKTFGPLRVGLTPHAFLQASIEGEAALTRLVLDHARCGQKILDLFCGAGTFAGPLLDIGAHIMAVDVDTTALNTASHPHLKTQRQNLFTTPLRAGEIARFDAVILDPPRAGAATQTAEIAASGIAKIIAVSCNPATFVRDAKILCRAGYGLQTITLVDQFIYSPHTELVAYFEKM